MKRRRSCVPSILSSGIFPVNGWVGSGGSLFCVVPRDPNATVVVNRVRWNEAKGGYETLEVLYRSESGDPILLFISNDLGLSPPIPRSCF